MPEILCVGLTTPADVTYQLTAQAAAGKKTQAQGATLALVARCECGSRPRRSVQT